MTDVTNALDHADEDLLDREISDAALEAAADNSKAGAHLITIYVHNCS